MRPGIRLLSMLLMLELLLTCLPLTYAIAEPRFDAISGATGGGGGNDDDDDKPSSFGNSAVDAGDYELAPFDPGDITGTALSALMDASPIFCCASENPVHRPHHGIRGGALSCRRRFPL